MTLATDSNNKNKKQPVAKVLAGVSPELSAEKSQNVEITTTNAPDAPKPADQKPAGITSLETVTVPEVSETAKVVPDTPLPVEKPASIPTSSDIATTIVSEVAETESAVSSLEPSEEVLTKAMNNNPAELESLIGRDSSTLNDLSEVMDQGMRAAVMEQKDQKETPSPLPPSVDEEK